MSAAAPTSTHELDERLADRNMFAWYGPAFTLAFKHWPISVVASLAMLGLNQAFYSSLTLLSLPYYALPWWVQIGKGLLDTLAYVVLVAVAYCFVAQRENVGETNRWGFLIVRAVQIAIVWVVVGALLAAAIGFVTVAVGSSLDDDLGTLIVFGVICLIAAFLLMPIWFSLAVAGALSTVFAVRSAEGPIGAVMSALRLAFSQKWRVFWPSYVIVIVVGLLYWVVFGLQTTLLGVGLALAFGMTFVTTSLAIMMTFVIERAYAPHLTLSDGGEAAAELSSRPAPGSVPPPRARPAVAPETPLPAAPNELAALLAADVQAHRLQRIVETTEAGLAADARFFVAHPDDTLVLSKRLAAVQRADLALRLVQPYLKEHRGHRHHLTVALYAANLLRDLDRVSDAARFLVQVKAMYPNEPMVDQLIKITDKALAAAPEAPASSS